MASLFAEDYEITERLGFGAQVETGQTAIGKLALTGNVYRLDTSGLARSAFTDRGPTRFADGGVSNTRGLESFSITLDGSDIPGIDGIAYHLGFRSQKRGIMDLADERGYVAGLSGEREWGDKNFEWITEFVHLDNAEGTLGRPNLCHRGRRHDLPR